MNHFGENPAGKAISTLKATFQRYAACFEHNKLDMASFPFEQWIKALKEQFGIAALYSRPVFRFDNKKTQEEKIIQDNRIKRLIIEKEKQLKEIEEKLILDQEQQINQLKRDEKSRQNQFNREEKLKNHLNDARIKLLDQAVDDLVLINRERLKDAVDYNGSFKGILEDSLKLLNAFHHSPQKEEIIVDEVSQADTLPDLSDLEKNTDPAHLHALSIPNETLGDDQR